MLNYIKLYSEKVCFKSFSGYHSLTICVYYLFRLFSIGNVYYQYSYVFSKPILTSVVSDLIFTKSLFVVFEVVLLLVVVVNILYWNIKYFKFIYNQQYVIIHPT